MTDPSHGIQRELLPHIHLVSTYRFPQLPRIHPEKVSEWLQAAPKIARDQAPFYWTYLDRPQDMTIFLVWQSMALGHEFPSDGYIWTPQEIAFQIQIEGGYTLEMYHHKAGYAPGEPVATHTRRRYRLLPPRMPVHQGAQTDPCLWIVHYATAESSDRIPSSMIPIDVRVQQTRATRQYLQSQGQIVQKEFMLYDRSNWPSIAFPRNRPQVSPIYGQNLPPSRIPQTMAYPPQNPMIGPPAKRMRTQMMNPQVAPVSGAPVLDLEEEEDTSRGDLFDHTTPREISLSRYKQNHEWMEEVISSCYPMNRIMPVDLGLGLRGELLSLTDGIFDAPLDPDKDVPKNNYVGRLDPEKADEFRRRSKEQIAQTEREISKMKAKHARQLAKFQKDSLLRTAEKELRIAVDDPLDTGSEYWRLEGRIEENKSDDIQAPLPIPPKVSDIVAQVEASLDCQVTPVKDVSRVQDGGFQEALLLPSSNTYQNLHVTHLAPQVGSRYSGITSGEPDIEMNDSTAGLLGYRPEITSDYVPGSNHNFSASQGQLQSYSNTTTPIPQQTQYNVNMMTHQANIQPTQHAENSHGADWIVPQSGMPPNDAQKASPSAQSIAQVPVSGSTASTILPSYSNFNTSTNDYTNISEIVAGGDSSTNFGEPQGLGDLNMDMNLEINNAFTDTFHGHNVGGEGEENGQRQ
ncbi:hypothetical protein K3495_g4260 [Podosphaera aphanis]|nr:hypothetical protein K3495_g4260 [Podosphaera aphanis]